MYILAIDQGTSSTKAVVFDEEGKVIAKGSAPLHTFYLEQGFVEQDPVEIFENVQLAVDQCLAHFTKLGRNIAELQAIGISNQRETFVLWNKNGEPLHRAVVWQCKRSTAICERLKLAGVEQEIKEKTGLLIDPYFSGTKLLWLLENKPGIRKAIEKGEAYFGTIDTWLLYKMTNGQSYCTDYSNASRTLFFNLHTLSWDQEILERWGLGKLNLPEIKASAAPYGRWEDFNQIPISAMVGDSHAAAFGEGCFASGMAKATLGTGCSILMNIGAQPISSKNGMLTTICWSMEGRIDYALEGAIVSCGSTIEWLKSEMGLFRDSAATEQMAAALEDNGGVYLVPAFSGLGAPHWDMNRKATISGLTFSTKKEHLVRAALESIPYQIKDVVDAMESDTQIPLQKLMVDGGISANRFVTQFLANQLDKAVTAIDQPDVSALGAAYLAGLQAGLYRDLDHLQQLNSSRTEIQPQDSDHTKTYYQGWRKALLKV